jgi:glycosylphosphatidylinositol transamidase (GPIT) subunit GPI8
MTKYRIIYTTGQANPEGRHIEFSEIKEYDAEDFNDVMTEFLKKKAYAKVVRIDRLD